MKQKHPPIEEPTGRVTVYPTHPRTGANMLVARIIKRTYQDGHTEEVVGPLTQIDTLPADLQALVRIIAEAQAILNERLL